MRTREGCLPGLVVDMVMVAGDEGREVDAGVATEEAADEGTEAAGR